MDRFTADGLTFEVTDAGPPDGEVIVLLHGFPETRACWDGIVPVLAGAGYRVLAPDQRGYSPDARPAGRGAYRLDRLAADVLALADAAGAVRFHVVGHDLGGAVAWHLAAWQPDRLLSMTSLTVPHLRAYTRSLVSSDQALRSWYVLFFQLPRLPEMGIAGPGRWLFRRILRRSGWADRHVDRELAVIARPGATTAALNWYRAFPLLPPSMLRPVTSVPVLYVYPTGDGFLSRRAADLTGAHVTAPYRYEVLDGVTHWIPDEVPERAAALILEHVRAHPAPGPG